MKRDQEVAQKHMCTKTKQIAGCDDSCIAARTWCGIRVSASSWEWVISDCVHFILVPYAATSLNRQLRDEYRSSRASANMAVMTLVVYDADSKSLSDIVSFISRCAMYSVAVVALFFRVAFLSDCSLYWSNTIRPALCPVIISRSVSQKLLPSGPVSSWQVFSSCFVAP